jgi:hypothetical protein
LVVSLKKHGGYSDESRNIRFTKYLLRISGSRGNSEAALFVNNEAQQGHRQLQESRMLGMRGKGAFDELNHIFADCLEPNWDGYGAMPVSEATYRQTYQFLEALPWGTPLPSFGAEPDGHLTLEWYRSPSRTLSISVSPEGELHYAALLGTRKAYGTEPFFGDPPRIIMDLIQQVTKV